MKSILFWKLFVSTLDLNERLPLEVTYMAGSRKDRNIRVNTGKRKTSPAPAPTSWSRPAEGREKVQPTNKKAEQKSSPRRENNQRRNDRRGRNNQHRGRQNNRGQRQTPKSPLMEENWARVIDHDQTKNEIIAVSEGKLLLCRLKPKPQTPPLLTTARVYIGTDEEQREHIDSVLGMTNLGRVANHVKADLPLVVQIFIEENEHHFISAFFNVAGNMSLKQHAFELLSGVGNKKAMQMVEARGTSGFESLAALNEACNIDAGELLAKRFLSEIEDRNIQPRLLDLLLPVKA